MYENRKPKSNKKIIIFAAAAIIAAVVGAWLLMSPKMERDKIEAIQEAMIEEILNDINSTDNEPEETEDFTDIEYETETEVVSDAEDYDGFGVEYSEHETEQFSIAVYTPIFAAPIPETDFPNAITGIGILTIESINLRLPIAEGIDEDTLRIAPGRVPQTAQVGDIGNAVIAGHRNYAFGSMFNRFDEIEIGNIVQYQARNGELMEFTVFEIAVIEPEDQIAFLQPVTESIITLYTCTPIREATYRLIIRARRVNQSNINEGGFEIEHNAN